MRSDLVELKDGRKLIGLDPVVSIDMRLNTHGWSESQIKQLRSTAEKDVARNREIGRYAYELCMLCLVPLFPFIEVVKIRRIHNRHIVQIVPELVIEVALLEPHTGQKVSAEGRTCITGPDDTANNHAIVVQAVRYLCTNIKIVQSRGYAEYVYHKNHAIDKFTEAVLEATTQTRT